MALVRDVVVLAENAAQVAAGEEDSTATIVALDAWLLAKVRRDRADLDVRSDEAYACCFVPIHAAHSRAKVAVAEVGVRLTAFAGGVGGREEVIAGDVVVQEVRWSEVKASSEKPLRMCESRRSPWQSGYPAPHGGRSRSAESIAGCSRSLCAMAGRREGG